MSGRRKRQIGWAVGGALFVLVVRLVGWRVIAQAMVQLRWGLVLLCLLQIMTLALDAVTLMLSVPRGHSQRLGFMLGFKACLGGLAVNAVTPLGQLGEVSKWKTLTGALSGESAGAAVWIHNQLMFLTSSALFAVAPPIAAHLLGASPGVMRLAWLMLIAYGLATLVAVMLLTVGIPRPLLRWTQRSCHKHPRLLRLALWTEKVAHLGRASQVGRSRLAVSFLLMVIKRLIYPLEACLVWVMLGHEAGLALAFLTQSAGQALAGVAGFAPMQLGTNEGSAYLMFLALGRPVEMGIAVEVARHARRLLFVVIGFAVLAAAKRQVFAASARSEVSTAAPSGTTGEP